MVLDGVWALEPVHSQNIEGPQQHTFLAHTEPSRASLGGAIP